MYVYIDIFYIQNRRNQSDHIKKNIYIRAIITASLSLSVYNYNILNSSSPF